MGRDWLDPDSGYSYLAQAAQEARRASLKHWATSDCPIHYVPSWSDAGHQPKALAAEARRLRREARHD